MSTKSGNSESYDSDLIDWSIAGCNKRDYRAWFGLGQCYEAQKLWYFALYYFKMAHTWKPSDSRMLICLGDMYEKLTKPQETYKCYVQARNVNNNDPIAIIRLAR